MKPVHRYKSQLLSTALLGLCSGSLSALCMLVRFGYGQSSAVVWLPGLVFGLVVLLPLSRSFGLLWARIVSLLLVSTLMYPFAWSIGFSGVFDHSYSYFIVVLISTATLSATLLAGLFHWGRPACFRGSAMSGIAGGLAGVVSLTVLHFVLPPFHVWFGGTLVLWQTLVGVALWLGAQTADKLLLQKRHAALTSPTSLLERTTSSQSAPDPGVG